MWNMIEHPPQPFGECTICKRHDCGLYTDEEGEKQLWMHTPLEMDKGGKLVIGYQCIKSMSEEMGIAKRIVEVHKTVDPTPEQIHAYIMSGLAAKAPTTTTPDFTAMGRDELKAWLKDHNIEFTPQWGDEKLRELAMQHV